MLYLEWSENQSWVISLQWRQNGRDGVSNHQPDDCLLNRFSQAQIKENIKAPRNWPLWGEFTGDRWIPAQKASYADFFPFDDLIMLTPCTPPFDIINDCNFQRKEMYIQLRHNSWAEYHRH